MRILEIFGRFFWLGCIGFGGPLAHLAYFHTTFVTRLRWLDETQFAHMVALSQFLPGPGSSQVGFAIGLHRAGLFGGWSAFIGFTLPSFLLLYFAATLTEAMHSLWAHFLVEGLKLLALVVIADAVISLYGRFCRTPITRVMAFLTAAIVWFWSGWMDWVIQVGLLLIAALVGWKWLSPQTTLETQKSKETEEEKDPEKETEEETKTHRLNPLPKPMTRESDLLNSGQRPILKQWRVWILSFLVGGIVCWIAFATGQMQGLAQTAVDFFSAGGLVFGGGHVVLPFLQSFLGDRMSEDVFLTGYGLAQIVPGPMFTVSAFYGVHLHPSQPLMGALVASVAIFLPGLLLMGALYKRWNRYNGHSGLQGVSIALNAAVVGLLIAALYQPVFVSTIQQPSDLAVALTGGLLLRYTKLPVIGLGGLLVVYSGLQNLPGLVDF